MNQTLNENGYLPSSVRHLMLRYSRQTLQAITAGTEPPSCPKELTEPPYGTEKRGIFVTLRRKGDLRGCIGHIEARVPLSRGIPEVTTKSALEDYRFPPVTADEVSEISIEISILTPMKPVSGYDEIVLGRDGILLKRGFQSAVFLPQVAVEQGWTLEQTLTALSRKAGLDSQAWRSPDVNFETFQAVHFSE